MTTLWSNLRDLLADLASPSVGEGSRYGILVIALAHALAGAAAAALLQPSVALSLLLGATYWFLKEYLLDTLVMGSRGWRDGAVDAVFVTLGVLYPGPLWWPLVTLSGALAVSLLWRGRL